MENPLEIPKGATFTRVYLQYRESLRNRNRPYLHAREQDVPLTKKMVKEDIFLHQMKYLMTKRLITQIKHRIKTQPVYCPENVGVFKKTRTHKENIKKTLEQLEKLVADAKSHTVYIETAEKTMKIKALKLDESEYRKICSGLNTRRKTF